MIADVVADLVADDDGWGRAVRAALSDLPAGGGPDGVEGVEGVDALLAHLAAPVSGATPSKTWRATTAALLRDAGPRLAVRELVEAIATAPTVVGVVENQFGQQGPLVVGFGNADLARGAIWAAGALDEAWVPRALADAFARACERNDEHFAGAKVPNACVATLADLGSPAAIDLLWRFETTVEKRGFHNQITKALDQAARRAGVSVSELVEGTAPTHGLDVQGRRETTIGGSTAVLALGADGRASLAWSTDGGPLRTSVPAALRTSPEVDELAAAVRAVNATVASERKRLEQLVAEDRAWDVDGWARSYAAHPITAALAGRLLWAVEAADGVTSVGFVVSTEPLKVRTPGGLKTFGASKRTGVTIRPWHPIGRPVDDVRELRDLVATRKVRQPFKQAFREVYPLTPAEAQTGVYSNRFAAHVLRYPQLYALLRARRWWSDYLDTYQNGGQDGQAWRDFPDAGVQARFWFEAADRHASRVELCITDQVRFVAIGDRALTPLPLDEVPAVVFSEAMRDVDLFVSVASVANDPTWEDRGTERVRAYWRDQAFGSLEASAQTRRDALARIVPALRIADRCSIDDRWLSVRGDLRTYRIHLGSANVQMEPNDQYLCIVADRDTRVGKLYLPFDDDPILTMILSKAFLLADDALITDATILQQLAP